MVRASVNLSDVIVQTSLDYEDAWPDQIFRASLFAVKVDEWIGSQPIETKRNGLSPFTVLYEVLLDNPEFTEQFGIVTHEFPTAGVRRAKGIIIDVESMHNGLPECYAHTREESQQYFLFQFTNAPNLIHQITEELILINQQALQQSHER